MSYIGRLCFRCKKVIGNETYHSFTDDVSGLQLFLHHPVCWEMVKKEVVEEYVCLIFRASMKELPK